MTTGDDGTTTQAQAAVWCGACGIPYAAETVYCANCGAPLAALAALAVEADTAAPGLPVPVNPIIPTAPVSAENGEARSAVLAAQMPERLSGAPGAAQFLVAPPGMRTLDEAFPHPPRGLLDRVRQRQQAMSEDEIDTAAAAIIAQARHADWLDAATGTPRDALAPLADLVPDPAVREALQGRRERDRAWLIGGLVCCVLLILFALVISRSMSIGMLRQ